MPVQGDTPDEAAYGTTEGFAPYDPRAVQPTSSPAPSSEPPGSVGGTSGADGEQAGDTDPDPLPEFDARYQEEFEGLLYIGALTKTFTWLGHEFHIRTLTTGELAEVALAAKPYDDSEASMKAYQTGVVAASIVTVDGKPLPAPITTDPGDTPFLNRFRYVHNRWFPPVIDAVYEQCFGLEIKVREVIEAMGNRSG